jgi:hypothetical protein
MRFAKSLSGENFQTTKKLPTTASEVYSEGEALVLSGGKLTKCGPTVKPQFIAAQDYSAPATGNKDIYVYPVLPHHIYEAAFSADASAVTEGAAVTLDADGKRITATTTSGVATIYAKLGTGAAGTKAYIRFI